MKAGQQIWYINHSTNEIEEGTLISNMDVSDFDEQPTYHVRDKYNNLRWVLITWVFTTKEKAEKGLKKKIRQDIRRKREEIKLLKKKLV